MGKERRYRRKLHLSSKHSTDNGSNFTLQSSGPTLPLDLPSDDLFKNVQFDFDALKKDLSDDVRSVKSLKSIKSDTNGKVLPKKEKLRLRRQLLLRKIDTVNQLKKEKVAEERRKKTALIGDTKPLHDALPSIESLLKVKGTVNIPYKESSEHKIKGIDKAKKRKKNLMQGLKLYNQILNNDTFKKNPLQAVSQHIKHLVQQERSGIKTS